MSGNHLRSSVSRFMFYSSDVVKTLFSWTALLVDMLCIYISETRLCKFM